MHLFCRHLYLSATTLRQKLYDFTFDETSSKIINVKNIQYLSVIYANELDEEIEKVMSYLSKTPFFEI